MADTIQNQKYHTTRSTIEETQKMLLDAELPTYKLNAQFPIPIPLTSDQQKRDIFFFDLEWETHTVSKKTKQQFKKITHGLSEIALVNLDGECTRQYYIQDHVYHPDWQHLIDSGFVQADHQHDRTTERLSFIEAMNKTFPMMNKSKSSHRTYSTAIHSAWCLCKGQGTDQASILEHIGKLASDDRDRMIERFVHVKPRLWSIDSFIIGHLLDHTPLKSLYKSRLPALDVFFRSVFQTVFNGNDIVVPPCITNLIQRTWDGWAFEIGKKIPVEKRIRWRPASSQYFTPIYHNAITDARLLQTIVIALLYYRAYHPLIVKLMKIQSDHIDLLLPTPVVADTPERLDELAFRVFMSALVHNCQYFQGMYLQVPFIADSNDEYKENTDLVRDWMKVQLEAIFNNSKNKKNKHDWDKATGLDTTTTTTTSNLMSISDLRDSFALPTKDETYITNHYICDPLVKKNDLMMYFLCQYTDPDNKDSIQLFNIPRSSDRSSAAKRERMVEVVHEMYKETDVIRNIEHERRLQGLEPIGDRPWFISMGGSDRRTVNTLLLHCPHCSVLRDRVIAIDFDAPDVFRTITFSFKLEFCKLCRKIEPKNATSPIPIPHLSHDEEFYISTGDEWYKKIALPEAEEPTTCFWLSLYSVL